MQLQPLVNALRDTVLAHSVVHADETPVQMLKPGNGKTHRAYLWAYAIGRHEAIKVVVYDFCETKTGSHAKAFLGRWAGALLVDDFSGYKQLMKDGIRDGMTDVGCWVHARRKFFDLRPANKSQIAQQALELSGQLYDVGQQAKLVSTEEHRKGDQLQQKSIAP